MDVNVFLAKCKEELQSYFKDMELFKEQFDKTGNLQDIMTKLSAYSARASHIYTEAKKSSKPDVVRFVDTVVEPFLNEVQFQFKIWSRVQAIMQFEFETSKG